MSQPIKQSTVKAMLTVARRGKTPLEMEPEALAAFTALVNILAQETLSRAAQTAANTGDTVITKEHLKRVITQIMLDFAI
ncbi:unnamed protein product [Caenorhabditis sp. 36 PRJEB53466]|nr:unnamed protein product [Caenorhabditis sp. 36 PRJEB53466]